MTEPVYSLAGAITAFEFLFYGAAFFVIGLIGLGYGKLKDGGPILLGVGIVNGIAAFFLLWACIFLGLQGIIADAVAGTFTIVATLLLVFALTCASTGYIALYEIDMHSLANLAIIWGITMLPYAYFAAAVLKGIWLTINLLSWIWAFWSITLAVYGKIPFKVLGWTFLIEAFYTLWIPAAVIIAGIPLP